MDLRRRVLSLPHLLLLCALCAAALLLLRGEPRRPIVSTWPGAASAPIAGDAAPEAPAAQIALVVQVDDGLYPDERAELEAEVRRALVYSSGRFASQLSAPVTAAVRDDGGCGLSGIAYTDIRVVEVHTCQGIARGRAVAILAHEFGHQLAQDRYGPAHLSADLMLSEGIATWAAGEYWLAGHADFRSYVRAQHDSGVLYPLATHYSGLGVGAMNALYYQWASFIEFLLQRDGREKLDRLYVSGAGAPGSADYQGVYGVGLDQLEREWLAWLDGP